MYLLHLFILYSSFFMMIFRPVFSRFLSLRFFTSLLFVMLLSGPLHAQQPENDDRFVIATWNIEWFGDSSAGPNNEQLQFDNVLEVITTIDADLYTFQEIADVASWNQLVIALPGYSGILASYSQDQRTAYLYRDETVSPRGSGILTTGQNSYDWAGRQPLWFNFDATINGITREIHAYGIHAKAFSDSESYQRRVNASNQLKTYLDGFREDENVIFFGDYNDRLMISNYAGQPSPYANFVDDPNYFPVTFSLEAAGATSFRSSSMIDHITVYGELIEDHVAGAQRVENTNYISNFLNTTSDHYPVVTSFEFQEATSAAEPGSDLPKTTRLMQNYPNPFNPSTNIAFELSESQQVTLSVYDVTGRRVAQLLSGQTRSAGTHELRFDAANLSSGIYLYRLQLGSGETLSRRMLLLK
jgi:endonuclease/exonuclease/phosphatase family metal-dependent hydrolase